MHKSEMADPHYVDSCPKVVRLEAVRVLEVILQARVEEVGDLSDGNAIGCS
jgi:hypothetical protein